MTWARNHPVLLIILAILVLLIVAYLGMTLGSDSAGSP